MTHKDYILIVEDDTDIRESLKFFLEMEGYVCETANNGEEGLSYLKDAEVLPKLILLDLMMPIIDGLAFRQQQITDARIDKIPVVLLSADRDANVKALKMGVSECVQKPVSLETLFEVVQRLWV